MISHPEKVSKVKTPPLGVGANRKQKVEGLGFDSWAGQTLFAWIWLFIAPGAVIENLILLFWHRKVFYTSFYWKRKFSVKRTKFAKLFSVIAPLSSKTKDIYLYYNLTFLICIVSSACLNINIKDKAPRPKPTDKKLKNKVHIFTLNNSYRNSQRVIL